MSSKDHLTLNMDVENPHSTATQHNGVDHFRNTNETHGDLINGRVPRAVPEVDDEDDNDDRPTDTDPHRGVDDGLLSNDEGDAPVPPRSKRPSFTYSNQDSNGFVEIDGVQTPLPDLNAYQHKKTLAQGMMDLALLSANANQLRYVLETFNVHPYYYPSLIFISMSIILQIAVGVGLILNSRYNIKNKKDICRANKINNYTVIGIFIVTVVNVFISSFGVADAPAVASESAKK